jgi:hypothetical protein
VGLQAALLLLLQGCPAFAGLTEGLPLLLL